VDTIKARSRLALTPAAASGAASFSKAITSSSIRANSKPRAPPANRPRILRSSRPTITAGRSGLHGLQHRNL
jgi:hypothetical protein